MTAPPLSAVVTGASRGLGLALSTRLVEHYGARTVLAVRDPGSASDAKRLESARPELASVLRLDYTDGAGIAALAGREVGLLINCGGANVASGHPPAASKGPLAELRGDALAALLAVDMIGPVMLCQALAPRMRRPGLVVNISTGRASIGTVAGPRSFGYAVAKAALNMATRKLAAELGPTGIDVVALDPGWVRTRMGGEDAPTSSADAAARILRTVLSPPGPLNDRFIDADGRDQPW